MVGVAIGVAGSVAKIASIAFLVAAAHAGVAGCERRHHEGVDGQDEACYDVMLILSCRCCEGEDNVYDDGVVVDEPQDSFRF